jgi:Raf kinase inhibitor-like YbhB/YbcL family protein
MDMKQLLLFGLISCFVQQTYAELAPFTVTSSAVNDGDALPSRYTCDGKDIQPEISWKNVPANTKSFALILSDPDAPIGTFYHWVLYNIPASVSSLPEGMAKPPVGSILGNNSWNKASYNGPCPPSGSLHHYILTLYALDTNLTLNTYANAATVLDAVQSHILGKSILTMTYSRQ